MFDPSQIAAAAKQLQSMSGMHPSEITLADLNSLALITLCGHHKGQAGTVAKNWHANIESYLREQGERLSITSAVRQLRSIITQLQSDIAKDKDEYEREVQGTREALKASQAHCSRLVDKLEEEQAAHSKDLALLRRQTEAKIRDERHTGVEQLKRQMEKRNADFERDIAASSKEIQELKDSKARLDRDKVFAERLERSERESEREVGNMRQQLAASNREISILQEAKSLSEESLRKALHESNARNEALNRKISENQDEKPGLISRLQQQDGKMEGLVKKIDGLKLEMTERDRQVELSSLPPKKKGLFAIFRRSRRG